MRETLEALAAGELGVEAAAAELAGYAETDDGSGRFDAAREERTGIPEAVLASGKTPAEVADLVATAVETKRPLDGPVEACGRALPSCAVAASKAL